MDKAAIFTAVTIRNAIRREARLPLLNIRDEFRRAVEIAAWREAREKHIHDVPRIRQEVIADLRRKHGDHFGYSTGGRWVIDNEVSRRFIAILAAEGVKLPQDRHPIVYGEGK